MKHLILLSFLLFTLNAQSQSTKLLDKLEGNSIGLFYNNNSFNLGFKFRTTKGKTILLKSSNLLFQNNESSRFQAAAGVQGFLLKDYELTEKFFISHGLGTGISLSSSWNQAFANFNGLVDLIYRTEFNYRINEAFTMGVALNPSIRFTGAINSNIEGSYNMSLRASQSAQLYCFYDI